MSKDTFSSEFLAGVGRPAVVTDAIAAWPALSKWTFEFFAESFGGDLIIPAAGLCRPSARKLTTIRAYVNYVSDPAGDLAGFWYDPHQRLAASKPRCEPASPFYLFGDGMFNAHPELSRDVESSLYFIDDWSLSLQVAERRALELTAERSYRVLLIGPEGALSHLHYDFGATHSCLAQIRGFKRCILFSPEDSPFLYDGKVDPATPDLKQFPLFSGATPYEAVIGPGDVLVTPPRWWHYVESLTSSITIAHNFYNFLNCHDYLSFLLARATRLVSELEKDKELSLELGLKPRLASVSHWLLDVVLRQEWSRLERASLGEDI